MIQRAVPSKRRGARHEGCSRDRELKIRAARLAFAFGLALARGACGEDTFDAPLPGSNEEPGPAEAAPGEEPQASSTGKADQTISFRPLSFRVYRDPDFTLEASATSGLRVTFTASGDCTVSGSTVHILSAGKCWVTAHQPGDERFNAAPDVEQRFTIEKASQTITGVAPQAKTYLDPDFLLNLTASSGLPIVFVESGDCTVSGSTVHILCAGICTLTAHQPGDSNFTAAPIVDLQFPIAKADQRISFGKFSNPVHGERDLPLVARATSGLPVSISARGSCLIVGSSVHVVPGNCTLTAQQFGNANFNAAPPVTQTFTILGPN